MSGVHNIEDSVEGKHNEGECETNQGPIISAVSTLITLSIRTGDNNTDIQQLSAQIFPQFRTWCPQWHGGNTFIYQNGNPNKIKVDDCLDTI